MDKIEKEGKREERISVRKGRKRKIAIVTSGKRIQHVKLIPVKLFPLVNCFKLMLKETLIFTKSLLLHVPVCNLPVYTCLHMFVHGIRACTHVYTGLVFPV